MNAHHAWHTVCSPDDLADDSFREFTLIKGSAEDQTTEQRGFVFRRNGRVYGYLNRCPHLGIELNWMPGRFMDSDNCFIQCSTHGALFLPDSGECIAGPCQGEALTPLEVAESRDSIQVRRPE
ncbi:Rieske (2Fe-2S) protein [Marinobacter lipolyticus]|uniref:Rieske (2Fe-2S) protein n=1 Tax=Marinobacter lipolyticus TaxID=209639 RepID=UPI003A8D9CC7